MLHLRWANAVYALAGVAALVALCLLVHPLREAIGHAAHGDTSALREQLRGTGVAGVVLLYGLMLAHVGRALPGRDHQHGRGLHLRDPAGRS